MNYGEGVNVLWGTHCPYKKSDCGVSRKRYLIPQENLVGSRFSLDDNDTITLDCSGTINHNAFPYRLRRTYFPYLSPSPKPRAPYGVKDVVIQWQEWKQDWKRNVARWKREKAQAFKTDDYCKTLNQDEPEVGPWSFTGGCIACSCFQETKILLVGSGEEGDKISVIPLEDSDDDVFLLKANESKLWVKKLKNGRILQIIPGANDLLGVRQSQRASLWSLKTKDHCVKVKRKSSWQSSRRLSCMCLNDTVKGEFCTVDIDENFIVHDGIKGTCKYKKESQSSWKSFSNYWHCVEYTSHPRIVHLANKLQIQTIDFRCPPEMRSKAVLTHAALERFIEPFEEISLLKSAEHGSYFYVGTSHCIFMADERFLNSVVQKWMPMFRSFPFYCTSVTTSEHDLLLVSSQLNSETLCIVNDWKHVSCETVDSHYGECPVRKLCAQENITSLQVPPNASPPRYLTSLKDTIDLTKSKGVWCEPEVQRIISPHILGLASTVTGTSQECISVFTVTSSGDVFSQELVPKKLDVTILPIESGDTWFASQKTNTLLNQNMKEEVTQREVDYLECWITEAVSLMETKLTVTDINSVSRIDEAYYVSKKKHARRKEESQNFSESKKEGIYEWMGDLGKYTDTYAVELLKEWTNENDETAGSSERREDGKSLYISAAEEARSKTPESDMDISFTAVKNEIMSDLECETKISLTELKSEVMADSGSLKAFSPSVTCKVETSSRRKKDKKRDSVGTEKEMNSSIKTESDTVPDSENYSACQFETVPSESSNAESYNIPAALKIYPKNLSSPLQNMWQSTSKSSALDLDFELFCSQSESVIGSSQPVKKKRLLSPKKKKSYVHGF